MKKLLLLLGIANLVVLDTYFGYLVFTDKTPGLSGNSVQELVVNQESDDADDPVFECDSECHKYIDSQIDTKMAQKSQSVVMPTPTKVILAAKLKTKTVSYIPIPGNGSTRLTDWQTLSGTEFYISKNDYPGLIGVYFEASLSLVNGNGIAYVRLFDTTHGIAVDGSVLSTSSQSSEYKSTGNLPVWEGNNLYKVQAKSLTADTTVFEGGKIKIITEN